MSTRDTLIPPYMAGAILSPYGGVAVTATGVMTGSPLVGAACCSRWGFGMLQNFTCWGSTC